MSDLVSPPTLDSLCLKIQHLEKMLELHRAYQREQVDAAYTVLHVKLDEMNKFREENKDLTARFVTREWSELQHAALADRLTKLELSRSNFDGRLVGMALVIAAVFALFELALHWWKP